MMESIAENLDLAGYSVADVIVGKAAAILFVKAGITEVYGKVMSRSGAEFLELHHIPFSYGTMTEKIINRKGDDICPMEKTVADISDVEEAYDGLKKRLAEMRNNHA